jgi:DNA-binding response OmpR family regulator
MDACADNNVLLVEEEPYRRVYLAYLLSRSRYRVTECAACGEALQLALEAQTGRTPFGLVIMDLNESSLAVAGLLRAHDVAVPIVFMTSCPDSETFRVSKRMRHARVLLRPYRFGELTGAIADLQGRAGKRRAASDASAKE